MSIQYRTHRRQLASYFFLLIRLAEKTEDKIRRDDLLDRIERTLKTIEAEDKRSVPCGVGWPP